MPIFHKSSINIQVVLFEVSDSKCTSYMTQHSISTSYSIVLLLPVAFGQATFGWTYYRGRNAIEIFRAACVCDPRFADCVYRIARTHGFKAGDQRVADAGPASEAVGLPGEVSRTDAYRGRAVRAVRSLERRRVFRRDSAGDCRLRVVLRSVRTEWPAGSARDSDGSAA